MQFENFRKLKSETVLPYWVGSFSKVKKAGYGWSPLVNTEKNVHFENKKRVLDRVVYKLEVGKCAIGVTVLIDNGLNGPLEDLGGGDRPAAIGIKRIFFLFFGMGVEEVVVAN